MLNTANDLLNAKLLETMGSLIDKFRKILSCIHEERVAIIRGYFSELETILERRQQLIQSSNSLITSFLNTLNTLSRGQTANCSLADGLDWLNKNLPPENLDLLLYAGQLSVITLEIRQHTRSLLSALEHQSSKSPLAQNYLIKINEKPAKTAVMVAETDDPG